MFIGHKLSKFSRVSQGFTLIELLVVVAIIAVIAAIVMLTVNPIELTRRSRDAQRLSDFANLQQAIGAVSQEATASGQNILCNGVAGSCAADSVTGGRGIDGTGWMKVSLVNPKIVSFALLPVDPLNTTGAAGFHYVYCSNGASWELFTTLESQQQFSRSGLDGGSDSSKYEIGTNLTLINTTMPGAVVCSY